MDRDLGARNSKSYVGYGKGSLYYQFGRKDPFVGSHGKFQDGYGVGTEPKKVGTSTGVLFSDVIKNPTTFYFINDNGVGSNGWNWSNESDGTTYLWNDENVPSSGIGTEQKSIFDPSPLGWRLPINGTFNNFDDNVDAGNYPYFPWISNSRTYKDLAYFPASGFRGNNNGSLSGGGLYGYNWCTSPNSFSSGFLLRFDERPVTPSNAYHRVYGFSVRPLQE